MEIKPTSISRSRIVTLIRMTGRSQSLKKWRLCMTWGIETRGLGKIPPAGQFLCRLKVAATVKETC